MQTAFEACNIPALMNFLDSRMSNLDYTLATFSNALAQISSGISTQDYTGVSGNSQNAIPIYLGMNNMWEVWDPTVVTDADGNDLSILQTQYYELLSMNFFIMFYGLLNFKAPSVDSSISNA